MTTVIRQSKRPRPDGRKSFIASHMGISLATFYKYRKGIWPQPFNYAERLSAAETAWKESQSH